MWCSMRPQRTCRDTRRVGVVVVTGLPDSLIATLPGRYYSDEAVFALEQSNIFEQMWFCAVRASDIAAAGTFRTVEVGRENLIVSRSKGGAIRAFYNVCRHRGARLCTEPAGVVRHAFQ